MYDRYCVARFQISDFNIRGRTSETGFQLDETVTEIRRLASNMTMRWYRSRWQHLAPGFSTRTRNEVQGRQSSDCPSDIMHQLPGLEKGLPPKPPFRNSLGPRVDDHRREQAPRKSTPPSARIPRSSFTMTSRQARPAELAHVRRRSGQASACRAVMAAPRARGSGRSAQRARTRSRDRRQRIATRDQGAGEPTSCVY